MSALGLLPGDVQDQMEIEVWPENARAVDTYCAMRTQWRVGPGGVIGLDYGALPAVLRLMAVPRAEWTDVFEALRLLEATELSELRKK